ncbi:MAG: methionine synthase [Campylobacteraceae bacterium 4484_4]|nr:MAG: methionine synthase [Campylobacteraceae bacterium 4484_4]
MSTLIERLVREKVLVLDGAMGTQIQAMKIPKSAWENLEGCNELLNVTFGEGIRKIHDAYAMAGADIIKTNTFGAIPWVLEDYGIADRTYELARAGAELVRSVCDAHSTPERPRFVAGDLGPGTKLPSLGHISYDEMYAGYKIAASGLIDGGCDLFLLETCQDPLQIKAALHACGDVAKEKGQRIPIMVSVTIELSGTMLIGTDAATIATIMEPFDILSLGFNCGTGPEQVEKHVKTLSEVWPGRISVHANAGLPQNRGGYTFYPMGPKEFTELQKGFLGYDGVCMLGGCCGTTPQHIKALADAIEGIVPKAPRGSHPKSLASLFENRALKQEPAPFLIGERSNATGSKAFRELLLAENYEGTLSVAQEQVRNGAHGIDISVGFAGRDETKDMRIVASLYAQKVTLPLMIDSTQVAALETGLKQVGGKPIINSVNLEDGIEKFDAICRLARRYGTSLVCLTIDEKGMAKTKTQKVEIAERIYQLATKKHGLDPEDLVFDLLTFTVGSGDEEYHTAAIETIEAIREFARMHPEVGFVLGVSNISFGLARHAREYLNSVFLHHCVEAGLTMAIVNVKNTLPMHKIGDEDRRVCEDLLFNRREHGDPLFAFIDHFSQVEAVDQGAEDEAFLKLSTEEKLRKLLIDGDKERMLSLLPEAKEEIAPERIVNEILIDAMKVVGELFGSGKMQLPFVLQSAETMKAAVDWLNPYLPKKEKSSQTTLVIGTVKGDVHDVGKNLVDIILTNNGFKVINIGIKADLEDFLKAYHEHNADAIGMSGLLVKSTGVMRENLIEMKKRGIDVPVLLGGAALTRKFIDEYCRSEYDGPIFYCKDAFDGITAMSRIEEGNFDTNLGESEPVEREEKPKKPKTETPPYAEIPMPSRQNRIPNPPFWGRRELQSDVRELAFEWINHKLLFSQRWGYSSKGKTKEEMERLREEKLWPLFEELKAMILEKGLFEPVALYGYYPCRSDQNTLLIFDEREGWNKESEIDREPLKDVIGRAKYALNFPRQKRKPWRCLADYFRSDRHDVVAFTLASAGPRFAEYEAKLYQEGKFTEYHHLHGLSVDLAEAVAEILHKQIRLELGIAEGEGNSLRDVRMSRYQGARYSFGYPACPDLSMNRELFALLRPEEYGITLSETFQMHPEQTTSAMVVHHPEALYFAI